MGGTCWKLQPEVQPHWECQHWGVTGSWLRVQRSHQRTFIFPHVAFITNHTEDGKGQLMRTEAKHDHDRDRLGEKGDHGHLDFLAPCCGRGHTHTHMHSQAHGHTHAHTPLGHLGCLQMFKGLFVICNHEQQSGSRLPALSEPHRGTCRRSQTLCPQGLLRTQGCHWCACVWHMLCECPVTCALSQLHVWGRGASGCGMRRPVQDREGEIGRAHV